MWTFYVIEIERNECYSKKGVLVHCGYSKAGVWYCEHRLFLVRTPAIFTTAKEVCLLNTILSPETFCVYSVIPLIIFTRVLWLCDVRLTFFALEGAYALEVP
jgi:hypothetical protein